MKINVFGCIYLGDRDIPFLVVNLCMINYKFPCELDMKRPEESFHAWPAEPSHHRRCPLDFLESHLGNQDEFTP